MRMLTWSVALLGVALAGAAPAAAQAVKKCPPDAVKVGAVCVDTYEASVWLVPDPLRAGKRVVKKILRGKAKLADLIDAGAVQLGCTAAPFAHTAYPASFPLDGNWTPVAGSNPPTPGVYAVSIAGVLPTACTTQLQARQACLLAGKRLITNDEWQGAAAGTPDPGDADDGASTCVTNSPGPALTGARTSCRSSWGVRDMVGNVSEWVADWTDRSNTNTDWTTVTGIAGGDLSSFGGDGGTGRDSIPAAPIRGGDWPDGVLAGVFAVYAGNNPDFANGFLGFRCVR